MITKIILISGIINSVISIGNRHTTNNGSTSFDRMMKSENLFNHRIERLVRCTVRVMSFKSERNVGLFYQRNITSQEILVSKYLARIDHDVSVASYGTRTRQFFIKVTIHNTVIFLHDIEKFRDIDEILNNQKIDRRGKFVICLSSIDWTEDTIFMISNFLWKFKIVNVVLLVTDIPGMIKIYSYTPMESKKCSPSKVIMLTDDCNSREFDPSRIFWRKMKNMNLCPIVASTLSISGAASVYVKNGTRKVTGFEGTVFNAIGDRMNFTKIITPVPEGLWGDELPDGTWNGVHGNIMKGVADVAFCLMIPVVQRLHFEEYSNPITSDRYVWILPRALPTNWNKLLLPFNRDVWIFTVAALIAALGVMYVMERGRKEKGVILLGIWGTTLGQPTTEIYHRKVTNLFILGWIVFTFILTNAYKSCLVSFLTTTRNVKNLDRVEEFFENNVAYGGASTPAKFYNNPDEPDDYRIYKNYQSIPLSKLLDIFIKVVHGELNFAALVPDATLRHLKFFGNWHRMREIALHYPTPFVFPRGSPYIEEFNIQITRLVEGGLVDYWEKRNTTGLVPLIGPTKTPLRFVHMASIFAIWLIGITLSGISFLGEIFYHRITKKAERKKGKSENGRCEIKIEDERKSYRIDEFLAPRESRVSFDNSEIRSNELSTKNDR